MLFREHAVRTTHIIEFDLTADNPSKPFFTHKTVRHPEPQDVYPGEMNLGVMQISAIVLFVLLTALAAGVVVAWLSSSTIAQIPERLISLAPAWRPGLIL